jgi:hypothetical protein
VKLTRAFPEKFVDSMFVFALAFLFFGSCFTRSATVAVDQDYKGAHTLELKTSLLSNQTCSPTNFTNSTVNTICMSSNQGVQFETFNFNFFLILN